MHAGEMDQYPTGIFIVIIEVYMKKMPMNPKAERWEICLYQYCKSAPTFDEVTAICKVNWKNWLILKIHLFTSL